MSDHEPSADTAAVPAAAVESSLTDPPETGEPQVDKVLAQLRQLPADPVMAQAELRRAHEALQQIISQRGQ